MAKPLPKVVIYKRKENKGETYQDAVKNALALYDPSHLIKKSDKILVDLNLLINEDYERGNITDPRTCEGIVDYLENVIGVPGENIWVGDGGYPNETQGAIKRLKLHEMSQKFGFNVIDLNKDEKVENVIPENALALKKINIAKTAMDADVIISVPSLKTHSMAVTTISIKNLMGTILPKGIMHSRIHKKLADLLTIFKNKRKLAVVDGFIGSDGIEEGGSPIKMDLVIIGEDFVAVDTVGSAIIGYTPDECKYLKYAKQKGLGECDIHKIEIVGEPISAVYRKFER